MKLDFQDRTWQFALEDATVTQSEKILAFTGVTSLMAWYRSITDMEAAGWLKTMQAFYWLMGQQNGDAPTVELGAGDFAPMRLFEAFGVAAGAEAKAAAEAEPDPTNSGAGSDAEAPTASPATLPG